MLHIDSHNTIEPAPTRSVHWMALQMSELTMWDVEVSRLWIEVDGNSYSIPVAKTFLHKLLDAAAIGVQTRK